MKNQLNEIKKLQRLAGIIKEDYNKPTAEHVRKYWETMIEQQPEDVLNTLVDLTTGQMSFESFITNITSDISDSYSDELYSGEDD